MKGERDYSIEEDYYPNLQPIQKRKKNFDDDFRNVPAAKTSISEIGGELHIFSSLDLGSDRVVLKLDKEMPEISVVASSIKINPGEKVLFPNAENGALALVMAAKNPDSSFFLYEKDTKKRLLLQKNIQSNFDFSRNITILEDNDLDDVEGLSFIDKIIFNGLRLNAYSSKSLFINALNHYQQFLKTDGEFYLISKTSSGADSHRDILESVFEHEPETVGRGRGGHKVFMVRKSHKIDNEIIATRKLINFNINNLDCSFETDEALFSKNDIDKGTRILLESTDLSSYRSMMDFGCGWGPIGIISSLINTNGNVVMIDNNQRAVDLASDNIKRMGLEDRAVAIRTDNIRGDVQGQFDLVLSNPPFHIKTSDLIDIFSQIKEKMRKGGAVYLVVEDSYKPKFEDILLRCFGNFQLKNDGKEKYWIISAKK